MLNRTIAPPVNQLEDFLLPESEKVTLPSGAEVYYLVNTTQPVIRLEIVFPAGKWYEPSKGVSYFTSKLLLEGTKTKSAKQIADILDFYGASLECSQGFDWATLTLYCLSKHYIGLLDLVAEILNEASFPDAEFKLLQQRTVQNFQVERKKPSYLAMEKFSQNVFGKDHPYTSGLDTEAISKLDLNHVIQFYQNNYNMSDAKVFVCGDLDLEAKNKTESLIRTQHQAGTFLSKNYSVLPGPSEERIQIKDSLQSAVRVGKLFPLINDQDYLKLAILNKILGGYFGSRLMKNIREDKGFTYGIHSSLSVRKNATAFVISTEVNVDKAKDTLIEIQKEIKVLQTQSISAEELHTVKNFMVGKFLNDSTTVFDQLDKLKHVVLHNLPSDHYSRYLQTIKNFKSEDLVALSIKYLEDDMKIVYTSN